MGKYLWPASLLEEHKVPDELIVFFQKVWEESEQKSATLENLNNEHQLLMDTSSKQERYIAELEKQIGLLQKTLDLVDKNKPRFIVKRSSADIVDIFNKEPVILQSEADSIIPIYPDRWIPVTERLPMEEDAIEGGFVLANTEEKVIIAHWSDVCRFNEFVTHWMPLPEPPKGD